MISKGKVMSDKTIAQKLLIKEGYKILILNAPAGYLASIGELPPKVSVLSRAEPNTDLVQVFIKSRKEMETQLPRLKESLRPGGLLWVTYPKGTSGVKTDINRDIIAEYARTIGMVGVAMVAVDDTWSALRLKPV